MSKFKVEIVETYRRYVEVEAEDEDAAYQDIDDKINEGEIDLPCDGEDYKYDRELFMSEVKENEWLEENDMERYDVEDIILTMADIVRENRYLREENDRLSKIEKEYQNSIFERAKESEQASRNMLNAALVGITQGKSEFSKWIIRLSLKFAFQQM